MSSVHYKFKATLEYKTLTFDGLHIGVDELKKAICDKENIRTESFDLLLTNAHTKREYSAGELVPRNSSVVVQRVPRDNAQKLPKVQDTSTSGIVQRGLASLYQQQQNTYINPDDFAKLSEEQRIAHIKQVSTEKYSSSNYQRRTGGIMSGPPPATYVCNRCGQPGHWYKNCPLLNTRRTTGIPMDELMETTRDDPLAMLHPSGKFVKPIMHHQARLQRKHEPFPGQQVEDSPGGGSPYTGELVVPEQYRCTLCKGLLRDAVLAACCGHSFCAECYQQQLLANPAEPCPGPDCSQQISADSLIPNKTLRAAIQKYLNEIKGTGIELVSMEQQYPSGVNKPSVLSDTQSLLHKLMPNLAYAQAQRELATAGRSPQQQTHGATPPPQTQQPKTVQPLSATIISPLFSTSSNLQDQQYRETTTMTNMTMVGTTPMQQYQHSAEQPQPPIPSELPDLQPALPLFDPHKPPPPLMGIKIPGMAPAASTQPPTPTGGPGVAVASTTTQPTATTAGTTSPTTNAQPQQTKQPPPQPTPLSAEEMSSVWESFLKRKEGGGESGASFSSTRPSLGASLLLPQSWQQSSSASGPVTTASQSTPARADEFELPPPGAEPSTPAGIAPPGTGAGGDPLSLSANHSAARIGAGLGLAGSIRILGGPNAPPSEITDAWLSFLQMKDKNKQHGYASGGGTGSTISYRYSISPERRTPSPTTTRFRRKIRPFSPHGRIHKRGSLHHHGHRPHHPSSAVGPFRSPVRRISRSSRSRSPKMARQSSRDGDKEKQREKERRKAKKKTSMKEKEREEEEEEEEGTKGKEKREKRDKRGEREEGGKRADRDSSRKRSSKRSSSRKEEETEERQKEEEDEQRESAEKEEGVEKSQKEGEGEEGRKEGEEGPNEEETAKMEEDEREIERIIEETKRANEREREKEGTEKEASKGDRGTAMEKERSEEKPKTAALNQLDFKPASTLEERGAEGIARMLTPDFEDETRWKPLAEVADVEVHHSTPEKVGDGNELFINMGEEKTGTGTAAMGKEEREKKEEKREREGRKRSNRSTSGRRDSSLSAVARPSAALVDHGHGATIESSMPTAQEKMEKEKKEETGKAGGGGGTKRGGKHHHQHHHKKKEREKESKKKRREKSEKRRKDKKEKKKHRRKEKEDKEEEPDEEKGKERKKRHRKRRHSSPAAIGGGERERRSGAEENGDNEMNNHEGNGKGKDKGHGGKGGKQSSSSGGRKRERKERQSQEED